MNFVLMLRAAVVAMLIAFGAVAAAPVAAQDAGTPGGVAQTTDDATNQAEDVVTEDDDGFEWGLLGLLGLAGLAGLMRRPQPVVHDIDRTAGTTGTAGARRADRNDSGGTSI